MVTDRGAFSVVFLIAFAVDLFFVLWLVHVGVGDQPQLVRTMGRLLVWFFTRRPLLLLGQHSLHVFSFHILVYHALRSRCEKGRARRVSATATGSSS